MEGMDAPLTAGGGSVDMSAGGSSGGRASGGVAAPLAEQAIHHARAGLEAEDREPVLQQEMARGAAAAAREGLVLAGRSAVRVAGEFQRYIQMGPKGLSWMCTIGAFVTICIALLNVIWGVLSLEIFLDSPVFVLNVYLFFFGIASLLLEVDVDRVSQLPVLGCMKPMIERWQQWVYAEIHLVTGLKGRGLFYILVGLFCMVHLVTGLKGRGLFYILVFTLHTVVGLLNIVDGTLCLLAATRSKVEELSQNP